MNVVYGTGFQPYFSAEIEAQIMLCPPHVDLVELGVPELSRIQKSGRKFQQQFSLHLARTPIAEDAASQDRFIGGLVSLITSSNLASIGIHITGPRDQGIGRLGFSSHFYSNERGEQRACRFVEKLKSEFGLPIWLENANFYSASVKEIYSSWQSVCRIAEQTHSQLIVDLTHLYIDCQNVGIEPAYCFGLIPWWQVAEIHLSGMIRGNDGCLHDGHSQPIPQEIWKQLSILYGLFLKGIDKKIIFTIEHTDPSWGQRRDEFYFEYQKLIDFFQKESSKQRQFADRSQSYAISHLVKILTKRLPQLVSFCEQNHLILKDEVQSWAGGLGDRRIVLSPHEVENENTVLLTEGIISFLEGRVAV